jgi:hypothetical protein
MAGELDTDSRAQLDKEALRRKYREERDKRLRPDGNAQYLELKGQFSEYLDDPYMPVIAREPKTDHVVFACIGGGDGIATAFAASLVMPVVAGELVRIGAETGDLASMLLKAGDILRQEFEATSVELIAIVTPISIVLLGLLIGGVAATILGTVMEVYDLAL